MKVGGFKDFSALFDIIPFGSARDRVLHRLRLVQNGGVVVVAEQRFMVPVQQRVGRDDEMMVGDSPKRSRRSDP